jgi:sodium-dependent phosphate cotransporter
MASTFQDFGGMSLFNPLKAIVHPSVQLVQYILGDTPWLLLIIAVISLFIALRQIVRQLRGIVVKKAEGLFDKVLFKSALRAFVVGLLLTMAVQSSSITTSLIIPLAGAGILTLHQIFPYTLGANIGTTVTAILASLVTGNISSVQVAFAHLLFNISGISIWWPLSRIPVSLAEHFSALTLRSRFLPVLYILVMFFVIPLIVLFVF